MKKCTLNKIYHKSMYMYVEYRYFQERKSIFQAQFFLLKIFNGDIMVKLVKLVSSKYPLSLTKAPQNLGNGDIKTTAKSFILCTDFQFDSCKYLSDREDHLRTSLYPNIQNHSTHFKCTYRWSALFVFRIRNMDVFFTNLICILLVVWKKTGFRQ